MGGREEGEEAMNLNRLYEILGETTVQLRKGERVIDHETASGLQVREIYLMPHVSDATADDIEMVDCHFLVIGVDKRRIEQHRAELIEILATYPEPERLAEGPSFIEVGAVIGDQGAAFQLFALGEVLGLWKVVTPARLGITDKAKADHMAGGGLVLMTGYPPAKGATP